MNNRICKKCKSRKVVEDCYYAGSTFYRCENCKEVGMQDNFPKQTAFDLITQSPETLAMELVFWGHDKDGEWYTSHFLDEDYPTEAEAIAATVAKLKEVCND